MTQESTIKNVEIEEKQERTFLKFTFIDDSALAIPMNIEDADKLSKLLDTHFKDFKT